ncbi:MAG: hypothetical protein MUO76_09915 [Anaerolineaceae bacterium]|nr:hypothetical protein [Anaerolineaceae bacterium]
MPRKLVREAGIEESMKEISKLRGTAVEIERTIGSPKLFTQFETKQSSPNEDPKEIHQESEPEEEKHTD